MASKGFCKSCCGQIKEHICSCGPFQPVRFDPGSFSDPCMEESTCPCAPFRTLLPDRKKKARAHWLLVYSIGTAPQLNQPGNSELRWAARHMKGGPFPGNHGLLQKIGGYFQLKDACFPTSMLVLVSPKSNAKAAIARFALVSCKWRSAFLRNCYHLDKT